MVKAHFIDAGKPLHFFPVGKFRANHVDFLCFRARHQGGVLISGILYLRFLNTIRPSLQQMLRFSQLNLFERRDLLELLRGDPPEPLVSSNQAALVFS